MSKLLNDIKQIKLPKIGMRNIKTAIAIFLCLLINRFIDSSMPVYAAMTAVFCMQANHREALKTGLERGLGAVVGGAFAFAFVFVSNTFLHISDYFINIALISAFVVLVIYICNFLKRWASVAMACIAFVSAAFSVMSDRVSPYTMAGDRVIETFIGVGVALVVNRVFPYKPPLNSSEAAPPIEESYDDLADT